MSTEYFNIREVNPHLVLQMLDGLILPVFDENGNEIDYAALQEGDPLHRMITAISNASASVLALYHGVIAVPTYKPNKYLICLTGDLEKVGEAVRATISFCLAGFDIEMDVHPTAKLAIKERCWTTARKWQSCGWPRTKATRTAQANGRQSQSGTTWWPGAPRRTRLRALRRAQWSTLTVN